MRSWLAPLGAPIALASASASAEPTRTSTIPLSWTAPSGCPGEDEVGARLARLIPPETAAPDWQVRAVVTRGVDRRFALRLTFESAGRSHERALDAASCTELADAAAVIVALGVNPSAPVPAAPPQDPARVPSPPPATQRLPADIAPTTSVPRPAEDSMVHALSERTRRLGVSVLGGASVGVLPSPSFGASAAVAWMSGRLRVELQGAWFPPAPVAVPSQGVGGSFELLVAGASACGSLLRAGPLFVGPCAGVEGGLLTARGPGTAVGQPLDSSAAWAALKAGGLLVWYATPYVGLRVGIDGIVPLTRDDFYVPEGPIAGQAFAGVEATFF